MENSPWCNSAAVHQIATNVCTCHNSTAVMPCTKFFSDHHIRMKVRMKQNFYRFWIAMEKLLVKRGPEPNLLRWHCGNHKISNPDWYGYIKHMNFLWNILRRWQYSAMNPGITQLCLLWFDTGQLYPYLSGLLHWHWGNHVIATVPVKQPWNYAIHDLHKSNKTKQNTTKPCAYSMGYTLDVTLQCSVARNNLIACLDPINVPLRIAWLWVAFRCLMVPNYNDLHIYLDPINGYFQLLCQLK